MDICSFCWIKIYIQGKLCCRLAKGFKLVSLFSKASPLQYYMSKTCTFKFLVFYIEKWPKTDHSPCKFPSQLFYSSKCKVWLSFKELVSKMLTWKYFSIDNDQKLVKYFNSSRSNNYNLIQDTCVDVHAT